MRRRAGDRTTWEVRRLLRLIEPFKRSIYRPLFSGQRWSYPPIAKGIICLLTQHFAIVDNLKNVCYEGVGGQRGTDLQQAEYPNAAHPPLRTTPHYLR